MADKTIADLRAVATRLRNRVNADRLLSRSAHGLARDIGELEFALEESENALRNLERFGP